MKRGGRWARVGAGCALLPLLVAGCDPADTPDAAPRPARTTVVTAAAPSTVATSSVTTADCPGIGEPHPNGEVTFVDMDRSRLYAVAADGSPPRCLAKEGLPGFEEAVWGPRGDRVLLGSMRAITPDGAVPTGLEIGTDAAWTMPAGTGILVGGEGLEIRAPGATAGTPIAFAGRLVGPGALVHPAGTHLVVATIDHEGDDTVNLVLVSGDGRNPRVLSRESYGATTAAFDAAGRLLFTDKHADGQLHVHRLDLRTGPSETVERLQGEGDSWLEAVPSPFDASLVAFAVRRGCDERLARDANNATTVVTRNDRRIATLTGLPLGWLRDGTLVFNRGDIGCNDPGTSDLFAYEDGKETLLAKAAWKPALRLVFPQPPPAPPLDPPGVVIER